MTPVVLIAILVAVPILFLTLLRINAAIVFLSLCLGSVLTRFVAPDAAQLLNMFSAQLAGSTPYVSIILLVAPVILTALVMIKTVKGGLRLVLNFLPAVAVGVVWVLLAVPLAPGQLQTQLTATPVWDQLQKFQTLAVTAGALVSLLVLWLQRPKSGGGAKEDGHKGK